MIVPELLQMAANAGKVRARARFYEFAHVYVCAREFMNLRVCVCVRAFMNLRVCARGEGRADTDPEP